MLLINGGKDASFTIYSASFIVAVYGNYEAFRDIIIIRLVSGGVINVNVIWSDTRELLGRF